MAVPPPTGPVPPDDGSHIFRRAKPASGGRAVPPSDGTQPSEPAEPLELDDENVQFDLPPGSSGADDSVLSGLMLSEPPEPTDDPSENALWLNEDPQPDRTDESGEDALEDSRPPVPPSAADSSIFGGDPMPSGGIGSGWLDAAASAARKSGPLSDVWSGEFPASTTPSQPPSTQKVDDVGELFADLQGDSPPSDSAWVEAGEEAKDTGRVSDSEVRRVFDSSREPTSTGSMAEFDLDAEPIGGNGDAIEFDDNLAGSAVGSSIFDHKPETGPAADSEQVDFNLPNSDDPSHASASSGWHSVVDADPEAVADDLFGDGSNPVDATDDRAPAIAAAVQAGALGGVGTPPQAKPANRDRSSSKAPPSRRTPDDDTPEPKGKKRGGIGGMLAGLATGLALGVGGFATVYLSGLIPNEKKDPAVASVPPATVTDPQAAAKVEQLTADLKAANDKVKQTETALKDARDGLDARQTALDDLGEKLDSTEDALTAAKKEAADAKTELTAALASADPLKKEAEAAKKMAADAMTELETAKKAATDAGTALATAKKAAADAAKLREEAEAALEDQRQSATANAKLAADVKAELADAQKKVKAADDTLSTLVKDLQAAKLLDDKAAAADLPAAVKRLAAVASSGDAKKAAEALVAAQKERDQATAALVKAEADAKVALAKAEEETKAALTAAAKANTDADKKVSEAMKAADDKVKTAVETATAGLKKQLADATAAAKKAEDELTTAKAAARAVLQSKLDEALAKGAAAEKELADTVKALEAEYAAKLAEARAGAVNLVPAEMVASEEGESSYAAGVQAYRRRQFADAEASFAAAVKSQPADARYWYYLGLARTRTGSSGADDAFKKGAAMERLNKPPTKVIDAALQHLSFADKERVNAYRR